MGSEASIAETARLSTKGSDAIDSPATKGLIKALFREGHGTPFESCEFRFYFEIPIFVSRQIVKHRLCLSGDTRIRRVYRDGTAYGNVNNTIGKLYELWYEGASRVHRSGTEFKALLPNRKDVWVQSYDENSLEPKVSKVLDVVSNGIKTTVLVTTESGLRIRSTPDHKFFTPNGWKHLNELSVGDYTYREGRVAVSVSKPIPPRLREGIGLWTTGMRGTLIPHDGAICESCGEHTEKDSLELDHIIPVIEDISLALSVSNLKPMCKKCHRVKTSTEQSIQKRLGSKMSLRPEKIISISDPMEEETYDLVLEDPWHNFIAEGLCVHNSSINEASGRYKEMEGEFYLPPQGRPMQQVGKTMDYEFVEGSPEMYEAVVRVNQTMAEAGWQNYQALLSMGVAKEVARMHLPTTLYSQMSFKCNLRSVLNFITLRYSWGKDAALPSHPQYEVALVADEMAKIVSEMYPTVWEAYVESGYRKL